MDAARSTRCKGQHTAARVQRGVENDIAAAGQRKIVIEGVCDRRTDGDRSAVGVADVDRAGIHLIEFAVVETKCPGGISSAEVDRKRGGAFCMRTSLGIFCKISGR